MADFVDVASLVPDLGGQSVHVVASSAMAAVAAALDREGFRVLTIDGTAVRDASSFFTAAARGLGLPSHFGHNWDALVDCLGDWQDGADSRIAVLWRDAGRSFAADPQTFLDAVLTLDRAAFDASTSDDPVQIEIFLEMQR